MKHFSFYSFSSLLLLFSLSLFSLVGATLYCVFEIQEFKNLDLFLQRLELKAGKHYKYKKSFDELHELLTKSDPAFFSKHIETLHFLEPEKKKVQQLLLSQPSADVQNAQKILASNTLLFEEQKLLSKAGYSQSLLVQKGAVKINDEDLKKLLCLIEGTTIFPYVPVKGRAQLIIQELTLDKESFAPYQRVYNLNMKIFKREKTRP